MRFKKRSFRCQASARAFARLIASLSSDELSVVRAELAMLTVPTHIVWGTGYVFFPLKWGRRLADLIPATTGITTVRGARMHFPDYRSADFMAPLRTTGRGTKCDLRMVAAQRRNSSAELASCTGPRGGSGACDGLVEVGEEQSDGCGYRCGAGAVEEVEAVARVVGCQSGEVGKVAAGRAAGDGDEVRVSAEPCDVRPRPRNRGLDVGDVTGPAVSWTGAVLHRHAYPAQFHQVCHQGVTLQRSAADDPGTAGYEDQDRGGPAGKIVAAPHVQ